MGLSLKLLDALHLLRPPVRSLFFDVLIPPKLVLRVSTVLIPHMLFELCHGLPPYLQIFRE